MTRPKATPILAAIRSEGLVTSGDIWRRFQVPYKKQEGVLKTALGRGTIRLEKIASPGHKTRTVNAYRWVGETDMGRPVPSALRPGQRVCLRCGDPFASRNAGNRICPRCKVATDRLASGTAFDTPVTVRYR